MNFSNLTFLFFLLALLANASLRSQDIRDEFENQAHKKWLEIRQESCTDFSFRVKKEEFEFDPDTEKTRKIVSLSKVYSQGDFNFFETTPVSDNQTKAEIPFGFRLVKVANGKEAFMIRKLGKPDAKWEITAQEDQKQKIEFRSETLKPGWYQFQPRTVVNSLAFSMVDDPRLSLGRTSSVEYYFQNMKKRKPNIFDEFVVSTNADLGRIVTATGKAAYKSRPKGAPVALDFKFKFLADWNWLPLSMQSTTLDVDKDGKKTIRYTRSILAEYDRNSIGNAKSKKRTPIPKRITVRLSNSSKKEVLRIVHSFNELTMSEIAEIQLFRTFKDLSELNK